ncbi:MULTISPECIES: YlmC/YmxH family sporulation protein [Sporosarcina]|uniref:YlmC/YmxH family sporulation protein n=1 Tax=Sporosarcina TaxID=1569 RepID=UPI00058FD940|nr:MULTISPECIES: YlmC/YmxH family sporulation protein [Sporosarcina]WJY28689.1 YlmC/YmxH family sporulation protein [Sporosarcina sp. 0.2-SM1T-5]
MLLSELAQKELIQVAEGIRYGFLADTDLLFDRRSGAIIGFEIRDRGGKIPFLQKKESSKEYIPWSEIVLIGEHRILFGKTHFLDGAEYDE